MKRLALLALPALVSGCLLPPAAAVSVVALQGISVFTMGKSLPDQVITAFADQDCTLFRLARFEPVCRDYLEGESNKLFAEAKAWQQGPEVVGHTDVAGNPTPDEHAAFGVAYFPAARPAGTDVAGAPQPAATAGHGLAQRP